MMKNYDIKVTGFIAVEAENEDEAMDKFDAQMRDARNPLTVADLRWKNVSVTLCVEGVEE